LGDLRVDLDGGGEGGVAELLLQRVDLLEQLLGLAALDAQDLPRLLGVLLGDVAVVDNKIILLNALPHHLDCRTLLILGQLVLAAGLERLLRQLVEFPLVLQHEQLLFNLLEFLGDGQIVDLLERLNAGYFEVASDFLFFGDVLLRVELVSPSPSDIGFYCSLLLDEFFIILTREHY
jgi:hypothetical protein